MLTQLQSRPVLMIGALLTVLFVSLTTAVGRAELNQPTNTNVGGPITQNTTWTAANSPYIAISSVVVMPGVTLTIEPGVEVRFNAQRALVVNGTLARGAQKCSPLFLRPIPMSWSQAIGVIFSLAATLSRQPPAANRNARPCNTS